MSDWPLFNPEPVDEPEEWEEDSDLRSDAESPFEEEGCVLSSRREVLREGSDCHIHRCDRDDVRVGGVSRQPAHPDREDDHGNVDVPGCDRGSAHEGGERVGETLPRLPQVAASGVAGKARGVQAVELAGVASRQVEAHRRVRNAVELAALQLVVPGCVRVRDLVVGRVQERRLPVRGVAGNTVAAVSGRAQHLQQVWAIGMGVPQRMTLFPGGPLRGATT